MVVHLQKAATAATSYEYGCDLRRLYPWPDISDPLFWGSAIASIRPGEATTPHNHDEEETFILMSGNGVITVDSERAEVGEGDVIYLPRGSTHWLQNGSKERPLVFLTIFWGSPEARAATLLSLGSRVAAA